MEYAPVEEKLEAAALAGLSGRHPGDHPFCVAGKKRCPRAAGLRRGAGAAAGIAAAAGASLGEQLAQQKKTPPQA